MVRLSNTILVDASPDDVWRVLGDLTATDEWIPGVVSARVEGSRRECVTAGGDVIREEISDYSDDGRSFAYVQLEVPVPIVNSRGTFGVEPSGAGARIVWHAEFDAVDPAQEAEIVEMVDGYYKQTLDSLRRRVESPGPS